MPYAEYTKVPVERTKTEIEAVLARYGADRFAYFMDKTNEEAFLAHVVMPDGRTVYEHTAPRIAKIAKDGELRPLLPGPTS